MNQEPGNDAGSGAESETGRLISALLERHVVGRNVARTAVAAVADDTLMESGQAGVFADRRTVFDLASLSKPVLAVCAGICSEQGFDLDAPLSHTLTWLDGTWAGDKSARVLLSHRGGLVAHVELFRRSWSGAASHKRSLLRRAASATRPDRALDPLYSDLGYMLVGEALQRWASLSLDRLLLDCLAIPFSLDLGTSGQWMACGWTSPRNPGNSRPRPVAPTEIQPGRGGALHGIVHDDNCWALFGFGWSGHAGLFGTAEAVTRFGVLATSSYLGRGPWRFLPRLTAPQPGGSLRCGFDGVEPPDSMAGTLAGPRTFGHLGFTGTSLWCDPDRPRVTVLLTNRTFPNRSTPGIREARKVVQDELWRLALPPDQP